jgi:hypothetical protein
MGDNTRRAPLTRVRPPRASAALEQSKRIERSGLNGLFCPCIGVCILLDPLIRSGQRKTVQLPSPYLPSGAPLLADADLRRLAQFIARELQALQGAQPPLLSAAEVARRYRLSRGWVYKHANELGGQRMGTGPKARLRFRVAEVERRLSELQAGQTASGRPITRSGREYADLLPIGPRRARFARTPQKDS